MKQTALTCNGSGEWLASAKSPDAAFHAFREELAAGARCVEECANRLENVARALEAVEGTKEAVY